MSTDFQMVTTVKREFARRLPSDLVTLVLQFANENSEWKRACLWVMKNRGWMSKMNMLRNITDVQIIEHTPTGTTIGQCPPEELLRAHGAPLVHI